MFEIKWTEKVRNEEAHRRSRDKYLGQVKKDIEKKSHREVKELAWDRKGWGAAIYQAQDCKNMMIIPTRTVTLINVNMKTNKSTFVNFLA
jgi:hypothetical protein